ncbi:MAG: class I SAM-dependent methyltransferase [Candidatus Thermoplasmatota archaeon]|nr:class I SAM-dependent methyltransferase [Candidatus Thermoplasmatota archaeon]
MMEMKLRWYLIKKSFPLFQKIGIHITPNHYYEPIPDVSNMKESIWERETEMKGIDLNVDEQLIFADEICQKYKKEYDCFGLNEANSESKYFVNNGWFGEVDGDILYSIIRHYKPKKIIEIGGGWSTLLISYALSKNQSEMGFLGEITTIDPYLPKILKNEISNLSNLVEKKVQDIDYSIFQNLEENDILFIDSSHVVKLNSDVCCECLEILPRLNKGVLVHFHDIFLPKEYPKEWVVKNKFFWNESYLLQAFLMFNKSFKVIWAGNYMKLKHPEKISKLSRSQACQSFWIQKVV